MRRTCDSGISRSADLQNDSLALDLDLVVRSAGAPDGRITPVSLSAGYWNMSVVWVVSCGCLKTCEIPLSSLSVLWIINHHTDRLNI